MNSIDKIIRNKLSHHHAETPDGTWDIILSQLPEEKKNFRPWWLAAALLALVFASVSAFLFFNSHTIEIKPNTNESIETDVPIAGVKPHNIAVNLNPGRRSFGNDLEKNDWTFESRKGKKPTNLKPVSLASLVIHKVDFTVHKNDFNINENSYSDLNSLFRHNTNPELIAISLQRKYLKHYYNLTFKAGSKFKDHSICPSSQPLKKKKSLELYVSHDYGYKSLQAASNENLPYMNSRKETEKSLYSYSAGARIGYDISKKWALQSGINYSQINEKFEYIDPESNQTREITIKDYVYQNGKIVDSIINIQTVIIPGETQIKVNNKYRSFDIPILGRYTLLENGRFSISAVAGLYLNITSAQSGMIFDRDNRAILNMSNDLDNPEPIFKTYLGVTSFGALSVAYHITPTIDLIVEPNVRLQTQSITSDAYPLAQKFNTYGLLTGVRYNF